jgi:hypothetical protein
VDALGDREEVGVTLDHEPARVDAGAAHVREQRLQHLRDPAACGGRVHVENGAARERLLGQLRGGLEAGHPVRADERLKTCRVECLHLDFPKPRRPQWGGAQPRRARRWARDGLLHAPTLWRGHFSRIRKGAQA